MVSSIEAENEATKPDDTFLLLTKFLFGEASLIISNYNYDTAVKFI